MLVLHTELILKYIVGLKLFRKWLLERGAYGDFVY